MTGKVQVHSHFSEPLNMFFKLNILTRNAFIYSWGGLEGY